MLRQKIASTLGACGVIMLMFGISALPAHGAAPSPVRMAPSPRPAIAPQNKSNGTDGPTGHITGTIIDLRTGAPVAGMGVNVGGTVVQSDVNGNYDHWLPVGTYTVTLLLAEGQGDAAQAVVTVPVVANAATVQHLSFRSPEQATTVPTAAPAPQAAVPTPAPSAAAPASPPMRLPRTGDAGSTAWTWLSLGMLLLLAGGVLGFGPLSRSRAPIPALPTHASNATLLRALLADQPRPAPIRDALLDALLAEQEQRAQQN